MINVSSPPLPLHFLSLRHGFVCSLEARESAHLSSFLLAPARAAWVTALFIYQKDRGQVASLHAPAQCSIADDQLLSDTKVLSRLLSGPKETLDKWLTVVPVSVPKRLLASTFSQHRKYLWQSPCWHPDSSQLLTPPPTLDFSSSWASLSLTFYSHTIQLYHFGHMLAPLFFCLPFFPLSAGSLISPLIYWLYLVPALNFSRSL